MKTAVDSEVLLDVFLGDPRHGETSGRALKQAYDHGVVVACDVVWAEVRMQFDADEKFQRAMALLGVLYEAVSAQAAARAGQLWRTARGQAAARGGPRGRLDDFLVGAHAQLQAETFLTRDRAFYRKHFQGLRVVAPGPRR